MTNVKERPLCEARLNRLEFFSLKKRGWGDMVEVYKIMNSMEKLHTDLLWYLLSLTVLELRDIQ